MSRVAEPNGQYNHAHFSGEASISASPGVWIAIHTKPHEEMRAVEHLSRQGFHVYCPMIQKRVKHARSVREVRRPLFPAYLFAHINPDLRQWRPIQSTAGVRTVVRFGQQPAYLEQGFIDALKSREIEGAILAPAEYRLGQRVHIEGGAFDGLIATIIEMDEKDRLVVLMEMLNRQVKVRVTADSITAV